MITKILFHFIILCSQVGWVAVSSSRLPGALSWPADCGCRGAAVPTRLWCLFRRWANGKPKETSLPHHCQVLQWTRKSSTSFRTPPGHTCGNSEFTRWDWITLTVIKLNVNWKLWTEILEPWPCLLVFQTKGSYRMPSKHLSCACDCWRQALEMN